MTDGYIYCFSNPSMPGILKIGMTERSPDIRLKEANKSDTWKPPTPYKIELAKKVINPKQKETTLHSLLSKYAIRINSKLEFFQISIEEVKIFFDLIDGELWINDKEEAEIEEEVKEEEVEQPKKSTITPYDMSKYFTDGQKIKHTFNNNKTWIGIFNLSSNAIIYNKNIYKSLSSFALAHYKNEKSSRISVNGWNECYCEINEKWIKTINIREIDLKTLLFNS